MINQQEPLTHLGQKHQQSFSGLNQPGRSTNHRHWLTWVTTINSPSQDYTNPDDQPTTDIVSPGSKPTIVLSTSPGRMINQPQTLTHLGHNHQQSFSGLHQPGQSTNHRHWLTRVRTINSPSQDYTNPDDQPTTKYWFTWSQPSTVLLRTTPTWTINQPQTFTHLGYNHQQSFSGLHQPGRSTNHRHWLTWVTTINSPSQDYTNLDDQPTTNIDSPGSQPTTVLLRTTPTRTINQSQTLTHLGHNKQQSFSGLHQPGRSTNYRHWLTWVKTNNSPSEDYTNTDDQRTTDIDSPGSQPSSILLRTTPTRTINQPQTLTHLGHNQQQSFSGLHQPGRSTNHRHYLTWVTTSNSPSQDYYTNTDDQPATNIDSSGSQPTTVLLRTTTPSRTINQLQTLTHLGHNQQQSFSGLLHQPGRSSNYKHWLIWVTTSNSPSQDYTNPDDQPTTDIDSPGSQPTTVLLRTTTPTWTINQLQTLTHLDHNHQQSFWGLHQPGRSTNYRHWLTWVTTINSPSQDYTNLDDQPTTNIDSSGSQPSTVLLRTTPTRTINQPQTLSHLGHNQQQSFSGLLHQHGRSTRYKHWLIWVTTNNSPSQDYYTNPDDQPTTNIDSSGSQPTTVLLRTTTPTRTIIQLQTLTHLGHNQQQSFSGLHQPGWSTNHRHWLTWVTTNNSPSQDYYTNMDDQPTTNIDSPRSQPSTVLLRTTPTWTINQLQTLTHLGHNHQQSFSGLHQPGRSTNYKHWLIWVTTINSPSQDYTNPDDQPTTDIVSPGSQPATVLLRTTTPTRTINQLQTLTHLGHNQQQSFSGLLHQHGRSTRYKHWLTWVTTNNSPSQDYYTNTDDQPSTNIDSSGSKPTTVLLRTTTPTRTINQLQTLTHLGHNQQQSFSGLHQPGWSTNHRHWLTWVTTSNSPSQDYTNSDDQRTTDIVSPGSQTTTGLLRTTTPTWTNQPATNIDSSGSQPATVLLRTTTPTRSINQLQTLTHLGHNQQQSFSGLLHQHGRSTNYKHWLIWVTTNNSPSQDYYTNTDDQPTTNIDSSGSQPATVLLRTTPTRMINQPPTLTHLGHNQQRSFSGLHQLGRSTNYRHCLTWVTNNNRPSQDYYSNTDESTSYKHWLIWVTTSNSPSQDYYTNTVDQPTTNIDSSGSQPTTVLLRTTTPTRTIDQLQSLTHLGHNQQQSFSGLLHQHGWSTNYKHWLIWVTTNNSPSQDYTNQHGRSTNNRHWLTWVTTSNSPSQDYTNLDDQPTTNIDSPGSQPTTVLLRTTPTRMINQPPTLTHQGHNQQQSFSGLHQLGRSTNYRHCLTWVTNNNRPSQDYYSNTDESTSYKHWLIWVTTSNSSSQDYYTNTVDQPTTNIDSSGSQSATVLLRTTTPTWTINQLQTMTHLGHNQQQSFSGLLHQHGRSTNYKHWLIWVTTSNSPSQDYTNPDDQPTTDTDSPGSQPTTVLLRTTPTRTINELQTLSHLGHKQQQAFSGLLLQHGRINQLQTLTHLGHNQQQSFSGLLLQHGRSTNDKHWLICVTTNNSPSQDYYTNTDDQPTTNIDSSGSQPTTVLLRTAPTRTINQQQTLTHLGHNQQQSF